MECTAMKKRLLAIILTLSLLLTHAPAALAEEQPNYVTRGAVCDMLLQAADDYTEGLTRGDIIKGYENGGGDSFPCHARRNGRLSGRSFC
jgi:hypothetical protein